jgi:short-subunit dehydrogenase
MGSGRLALITGASSGIGATFARKLGQKGFRLILVARRRDRLEELVRELGGAEILPADLTIDSELRLVEDRIASAADLDLLINNAGFGTLGRFFDLPVESQDQMHRLHVMATMRLTHAALRGMVGRNRGGIINVSSLAGFEPSPGNVSYSATKAWMNSFTEALYLELRSAESAVRVQALCPGFTITEFHDVMRMDRKRIPAALWMRAEDVVAESLAGLERGKLFVIPGWHYRLLASLRRVVPRPLRHAMAIRYGRATKRELQPS